MLSTNPLVAGGTCGPQWKKPNLSEWSRCRVLFLNEYWLIMRRPWNRPTVRRLHTSSDRCLQYMWNLRAKNLNVCWNTVLGGERLEVMWKAVRWPYRYLGRRQSSNICVNPSSCESWIWFPCDWVGPAFCLGYQNQDIRRQTYYKLLRWCNNQSPCEDLHNP